MKRALVLAFVLGAAPAHADRSAVPELAVMLAGRSTGSTYAEAGNKDGVQPMFGMRLVLGFENAPLALPAPGLIETETRLVPELLTGFLADDVRADGYVGAGLRGELHLASNRRGFAMRTVIYAAARGIVIGGDQDGAAEFVIGEYLLQRSGTRFGWEGGAMMHPRSHADAASARELDALLAIYVGW